MKFSRSIVALAGAVLMMTACNNADTTAETKDAEVKVETAPEALPPQPAASQTTTVAVADVPEPVTKSFTAKSPKAKDVEWMTFVPSEYDNLPETKYFYVKYDLDGTEHYAWYTPTGDWIRSSTAFTGGSDKLPAAVNKMLADQYPGYNIEEIDEENDKDMKMYELELHKGEAKVKLKVLPDGTIFKKK